VFDVFLDVVNVVDFTSAGSSSMSLSASLRGKPNN
jgi:hypothetical protein